VSRGRHQDVLRLVTASGCGVTARLPFGVFPDRSAEASRPFGAVSPRSASDAVRRLPGEARRL
jgi:hypothetical protein